MDLDKSHALLFSRRRYVLEDKEDGRGSERDNDRESPVDSPLVFSLFMVAKRKVRRDE